MPSTSSGDAWHDYRPSPDGLPQYLSPRQPPGLRHIDRRAMVLECGAIEKPSEPLLRPCPCAFALSAGASPVLVVVDEPEGDIQVRVPAKASLCTLACVEDADLVGVRVDTDVRGGTAPRRDKLLRCERFSRLS